MDLSSLIPSVTEALGAELPRSGESLRIGVGDAAKPAVLASIARRATGAVLIVVPKAARTPDLYEELGFWLGPDDAARLRLYPQRDILPYERANDDLWDIKARLEVTA